MHSITEESFDLGRTQGQLLFEDDPYLSDRHCRFYVNNDKWVVQDLQSRNGVYHKVSAPMELQDGDIILLGKEVLCFELLTEVERTTAPAVEQGVLIFGAPLRNPWGRLRQLTVAGITRDVYHLHRPRIMVGREEGDLLFTDDEFMSRRHLLIRQTGETATAEDQGSSNGTFMRVREQHWLTNGDMLRVGDQLLRFELLEPIPS